MAQNKQTTSLSLFFAAIIFILAVITNLKYLDALPPNDDGLDNLGLANGLAHTGTMGKLHTHNGHTVLTISDSREPFPNWLTAKWIQLIPALHINRSLDYNATPRQLILLKWPNLLLWAATVAGCYWLMLALVAPYQGPLVGSLLGLSAAVLYALCSHPVFISTLLTEFHAAFLLVWFSWAWLQCWQKQSYSCAVIAGGLLGLLILTKAAFLYVVVGLALVTLCLQWRWKLPGRQRLQTVLLFGLALMIAFAWMWRNHHWLGAWEIAGRGPNVLLTRAYKSQMTDEEFKGAFYAYAPQSLKHTFKVLTGFRAKDREIGGRLQRFTRFFDSDVECRQRGDEACAIGYYVQANIRYSNIMAEYAKRYPSDARRARVEAEKAAKQLALGMIAVNPWGHLRTTLVFAWRGAWPCNKVDGRWFSHEVKHLQPAWQEWLPFAGLCSGFALALVALFSRNMVLWMLASTSTAVFVFYALASHFIPRYSEMLIPIWVICALWSLVHILLKQRVNRHHGHAID
ncbi:hypothetical protein [Methylophilus aquaticus]|uniref:Glycosyltransferase RgtA/B/C/D-like domain-containing protein n=1 Tax=Methylophilus aquaticus TaxID=1971610 RepID=A0ABT9JP57_9PROT|nr:hypothetical protein [Methylophilus aquaticus]MDP8566370.1 hypothetical protein [Methylophilus aquaticus]